MYRLKLFEMLEIIWWSISNKWAIGSLMFHRKKGKTWWASYKSVKEENKFVQIIHAKNWMINEENSTHNRQSTKTERK